GMSLLIVEGRRRKEPSFTPSAISSLKVSNCRRAFYASTSARSSRESSLKSSSGFSSLLRSLPLTAELLSCLLDRVPSHVFVFDVGITEGEAKTWSSSTNMQPLVGLLFRQTFLVDSELI